jgi:hypothetical protein
MNIQKPEDLLGAWEEVHGVLESKNLRWRFLHHRRMKDILKQRPERIAVAVRRNAKLHDVLEDLYAQDNRTQDFLDKYYPYRDSQPEELGSCIEQREKDGGQFPSSSGHTTSVGLDSIYRFMRPVVYQNFLDELLPPALQEANPVRINRVING